MTDTLWPADRLRLIGTGETLTSRDTRNDSTDDADSRPIPWPLAVRFMTRRELERAVGRLEAHVRTCRATNDLDGADRADERRQGAATELERRDAERTDRERRRDAGMRQAAADCYAESGVGR